MREITRRTRGISLLTVIRELNRFIPGWLNYFRVGLSKKLIQELNRWIIRRLRVFLWRRSAAENIISEGNRAKPGSTVETTAHESEEPDEAGDRPRQRGQTWKYPKGAMAGQQV